MINLVFCERTAFQFVCAFQVGSSRALAPGIAFTEVALEAIRSPLKRNSKISFCLSSYGRQGTAWLRGVWILVHW